MTATVLIISTTDPPLEDLKKQVLNTGVFEHAIICSNGDAVFAELRKQRVDMICWAFGIREESTEWVNRLHTTPEWADLPLLIFTEEGDQKHRLRGLELGACDSVTFSTTTAELAARFRVHLKLAQQIIRLRNSRTELARLAMIDPLTSLANRASFDLHLGQEIARSQRSGNAFSLMMIDLDHFKDINDSYGHQAGDTVLKAVASILTQTERDSDIACRYGGDEFAIIMPDATAPMAKYLAARLHSAVSALSFDSLPHNISLTLSIGLTSFDGTRSADSSTLVAEADTALYRAKHNGRHSTEISTPQICPPPQPLGYRRVNTIPLPAM